MINLKYFINIGSIHIIIWNLPILKEVITNNHNLIYMYKFL